MPWITKKQTVTFTENVLRPSWDAGARSIAQLEESGRFVFSVGQSGGIVCGLNTQDNFVNYHEIQHGFFIESQRCRIIESGVIKTEWSVYDKTDELIIERIDGVVSYYINDGFFYTSTTPSVGTVFLDCSLYAHDDAILDVSMEIIQVSEDCEVSFASLAAKGLEGELILLWGEFPVLVAAGEMEDHQLIDGQLSALISQLSEGDINLLRVETHQLVVDGNIEELIIPEYNPLSGNFGALEAYGIVKDTGKIIAELSSLAAQAADQDATLLWGDFHSLTAEIILSVQSYFYAEWNSYSSSITIVPMISLAVELPDLQLEVRTGANVSLELPVPSLDITGNDDDNISAALSLPALTLATQLGARTSLALPALELTLAATSEGFATVDLSLPTDLALEAIGYVGEVAHSALTFPVPNLTAELGAYASLEMVAPVLASAATVIDLAQASLTLPFLELTSTSEAYGFATVTLELPELELLSGPSRVELELPMLVLAAHAVSVSAVSTTTYAVNLNSGAITRLLIGEFDKLVVANGRLYGLQGTALYRMEGDNDGLDNDDEPIAIPATVRFAPQTFGVNQLKRLSDVYLSTRENDGMTLSVIADETTAWQYQTPTDKALAYGTHKVKTGRGVTFHTVGLMVQNRNGGRLDVGGMELLATPLSRKI